MTVTDLADYIVRYYNSVGDVISNKKLNKILYYIQGWHFGYFKGDPLFSEVPQAWVHGPVYPQIYKKYRWDNNIKVHEKECAPDVLEGLLKGFNLNPDEEEFLSSLLVYYSKKSGAELEITTHRERPWLETRDELPAHIPTDREIPLSLIKEYFIDRRSKSNNA